MSAVLCLMKTLPTYEHRKIVYHAIENNLADMTPTFEELVRLMEYMSDTKCKELCKIFPIQDLWMVDEKTSDKLVNARLTDSKITMLYEAKANKPLKINETKTHTAPTGDINVSFSETSAAGLTQKTKTLLAEIKTKSSEEEQPSKTLKSF